MVGYEKSFALAQFTTAPAALTFTKNAAVIYSYDRAETCSSEALPISSLSTMTTLLNTVTSSLNLVIGN